MEDKGMIYKQIIECMRDIKTIEKDQVNKTQGFKFRGIDQVYNSINPILSKHGVFTVPVVLSTKTDIKTSIKGTEMYHVLAEIEYKFYAEDGSSISAVVYGEALDSGDKAMNKAMSIAHKYAFFQIFAIPTAEEKDPDFESYEIKPRVLVVPHRTKLMREIDKVIGGLSEEQKTEKKARLEKLLGLSFEKQYPEERWQHALKSFEIIMSDAKKKQQEDKDKECHPKWD